MKSGELGSDSSSHTLPPSFSHSSRKLFDFQFTFKEKLCPLKNANECRGDNGNAHRQGCTWVSLSEVACFSLSKE